MQAFHSSAFSVCSIQFICSVDEEGENLPETEKKGNASK